MEPRCAAHVGVRDLRTYTSFSQYFLISTPTSLGNSPVCHPDERWLGRVGLLLIFDTNLPFWALLSRHAKRNDMPTALLYG